MISWTQVTGRNVAEIKFGEDLGVGSYYSNVNHGD